MADGNSWIHERALADHDKLNALNYQLGEELRGFRERVEWKASQWAQDMEFLEFLGVQRISLLASSGLALDGFYRDAYVAIRSVFEAYLLLALISTCDLYQFMYIVRRAVSDKNLEEAITRVEKNVRSSAGPELIDMRREGRNRVVLVRRGVPLVDELKPPTGRWIPFYFSAWKQYQPERHHLGGLERYLEREWSIGVGRRLKPDPRHRQFYRDYFAIDGMLDKLRLNRVLNNKTLARVRVHYNFLSGFAHCTNRAIERLLNIGFSRSDSAQLRYSHYHSELALLYVAHLSAMYLSLAVMYFDQWKIGVEGRREVRAIVDQVEDEFGYFWLFFNRPHMYDRYTDANRLSDYRKKAFVRPQEVKDTQVRYYKDPLTRLREMHGSTQELSTGNAFVSPFPRDDARQYL